MGKDKLAGTLHPENAIRAPIIINNKKILIKHRRLMIGANINNKNDWLNFTTEIQLTEVVDR